MPEKLAGWLAAVQQQGRDIAEIKVDVAELKGDVTELKSDVKETVTIVGRQETDMGDLKGLTLEARFHRRGASLLAEAYGLRRVRTVRSAVQPDLAPSFRESVESAVEDGQTSDSDARRVGATDLIVSARHFESGDPAYAAAEVSWVVDKGDIDRAKRTVDVVSTLYPEVRVFGAVYGMKLASGAGEYAEAQGIHVIIA